MRHPCTGEFANVSNDCIIRRRVPRLDSSRDHRACRLGRVPSIITLLDEGADIKAPNKEFMQPLDVAGIFQGDVCFPRRKDSVSTICAKYPSMRTMVIHHEDFLLHKPKEEHQVSTILLCPFWKVSTFGIVNMMQEHSQRASFVLNRLASAAYADQGKSLTTGTYK